MKKNAHLGLPFFIFVLSLNCGAARADVEAVVSAKGQVCALTRHQVSDIFLGKTVRFANGEIATPIDLPDGSAERDEFYAKFAGRSEAQIRAYWASMVFTGRGRPPREAQDDDEMKNLLDNDPYAIGYIERDKVDDRVRLCKDIK
jgi:ABC-type phosphate transport system substrate-binding protein